MARTWDLLSDWVYTFKSALEAVHVSAIYCAPIQDTEITDIKQKYFKSNPKKYVN